MPRTVYSLTVVLSEAAHTAGFLCDIKLMQDFDPFCMYFTKTFNEIVNMFAEMSPRQ